MGNVQKRSDGKWRARYRDPMGKEHARHFGRRIDAERWLATVEIAKARGEWVDPALSRVTVREWSARWLAAQSRLKPSTRARHGWALRCQMLPEWGDMKLSAITHADVVAWVGRLTADGYAGSTVRQAYRTFSQLLDLAVKDGRLMRNPAHGVRLPRVNAQVKVFLAHEQVDALAGACGAYGLLIRVLAYTGLRFGEVAALRVRRIDPFRRRIEVAESVTEVDGQMVWGTPKTHQRRSAPLPRHLVDELVEHVAGKEPDDLVFTAHEGGVLRNRNFRRRTFDKAAAVGVPELTPHALRHTAASLAVSAGANVKAVQLMLGHASAAMTLDVYANPRELQQTGEKPQVAC